MRDELGTVPSAELRAVHQRLLETGDSAPSLPEPLQRLGRAAVRRPRRGARANSARTSSRASGGSCSSRASRASARRACSPPLRARPETRSCSTAAATRTRSRPTSRSWRCWRAATSPAGCCAAARPRLSRRAACRTSSATGCSRPSSRRSRGSRADGALVLVCDDLHWADRPTLQLVRHLAAPRGHADAVRRRLSRRRERAAARRPDRRPAPRACVRAASRWPGSTRRRRPASLGADAAQRLHERTAGNPLFLAGLRDEDGTVRRSRTSCCAASIALGEPAYDVLALAAVAGQTFRTAVVGYIGVLDQALTAGLLTPTATPDRLAFSHALIRQTLYEDLSDVKRAHLHRVVAERLETRSSGRDPAELAHHYFRARHLPGPSRPSATRARRPSARPRRSPGRTRRSTSSGRSSVDACANDRAAELLLALGEARMRGGHAAARTRVRGGRRARPRRFAGAARARRDRLRRPLLRGRRDRRRADRAAARGARRGSPRASCASRVLARLAEILHFAGDTETSIDLSGEAVALARPLGDDGVLAAALAGRHVSLLHVEHVEERMRRDARDPRGALRSAARDADAPGAHLRPPDARRRDRRAAGRWNGSMPWRPRCASRCSSTSSSAGGARSPRSTAGSTRPSSSRSSPTSCAAGSRPATPRASSPPSCS